MCDKGYFCANPLDAPVACPAGYFSLAGAASCTACPAGSYKDQAGDFACLICPAGYACPEASQGKATFLLHYELLTNYYYTFCNSQYFVLDVLYISFLPLCCTYHYA